MDSFEHKLEKEEIIQISFTFRWWYLTKKYLAYGGHGRHFHRKQVSVTQLDFYEYCFLTQNIWIRT